MTNRPAKLVVGGQLDLTGRLRSEVESAGLSYRLDVVLDTYRESNPDSVLDHALWLASARAIGNHVGADETRVDVDSEPGVIDRMLHRVPARRFGSREEYASVIATDSDPELWQTVRWLKQGRLVSFALQEPWWRLGGPDIYHDSYTARYYVHPEFSRGLVEEVSARLVAEGANVVAILDLCE